MSTFESIVLASVSISLVSLVGGLFLVWKQLWTESSAEYLVSFAAGIMLSAAFLDLLPEAVEAGEGADIFLSAFLGVIGFFFLERFVLWFHHHDDLHGAKPTPLLIIVGDAFHNFIDGVAIAGAFLINPSLGVITTLAIVAHEVPQEVADFGILVHHGLKKSRALLFNLLSGVGALIGAIGGYFFLERLEGALPVLLAFTAGMFIYIACSDLIPEMHHEFRKSKRWTQVLPFILGIAVLFVLVRLLEG